MKLIFVDVMCCMLWKNGGGVMIEIVIVLVGVMFDNFDWCVSIVQVDVVGLFLCFVGIDWLFVVIVGGWLMMYCVDVEVEVVMLVFGEVLVCFFGEVDVYVMFDVLLLDFNVMMWCDVWVYYVEVIILVVGECCVLLCLYLGM